MHTQDLILGQPEDVVGVGVEVGDYYRLKIQLKFVYGDKEKRRQYH